MLIRLLYASRALAKIDDAMIESILERSRSHNTEHGITGVLCIHEGGDVFLQALEGGRVAVNQLYADIVRDPRHRDVTLLDYAEVDARRFASWRMGIVDFNKVNRGIILRHSENVSLDPFSMTGRAALALLEELSTSAAIVTHS
jgi:hypothetical protein